MKSFFFFCKHEPQRTAKLQLSYIFISFPEIFSNVLQIEFHKLCVIFFSLTQSVYEEMNKN